MTRLRKYHEALARLAQAHRQVSYLAVLVGLSKEDELKIFDKQQMICANINEVARVFEALIETECRRGES